MTTEEIFLNIERAKAGDKVAAAEAALDEYDGPDKDLISGWVIEAAYAAEVVSY
jgi:hypothetical protein